MGKKGPEMLKNAFINLITCVAAWDKIKTTVADRRTKASGGTAHLVGTVAGAQATGLVTFTVNALLDPSLQVSPVLPDSSLMDQ